jgi:hypothetical protein
MRSFLAACAAAIAIAVIAGYALDAVQKPADSAFSTTGARVS